MADVYNIEKNLKIDAPSDTTQVLLVAKYDILKHIRSKRLLAIGIILALVLVLVTFLGTYNNPDPHDAAKFIGNYAGFVSIMIVIGVTLFAGDAIVSEFQGRTGYLLFPNPVKKSSLYAGKFLASVGIMSLVIVAYYLVAIVIGLAYTGNFDLPEHLFHAIGDLIRCGCDRSGIPDKFSTEDFDGVIGADVLHVVLYLPWSLRCSHLLASSQMAN